MKFNTDFFAIILIGGMGSRFSKLNEAPKQLIKLNKRSLLENLLISFIKNGISNFVLPMGYKQRFFINFFKKKKKILNKKIKIYGSKAKKYDKNTINIILFDAGKTTSKLSRIKKSLAFFNSETFVVTYGDGIADIKLNQYLKLHKKHKKSIIASKYINSQYGHLKIYKKKVVKFAEKPIMSDPINIGYYFFTKKLFNNFFNVNYELENKFMNRLIRKNKIITYIHKGFFFNIDRKIDLINIKKRYKKILFKL